MRSFFILIVFVFLFISKTCESQVDRLYMTDGDQQVMQIYNFSDGTAVGVSIGSREYAITVGESVWLARYTSGQPGGSEYDLDGGPTGQTSSALNFEYLDGGFDPCAQLAYSSDRVGTFYVFDPNFENRTFLFFHPEGSGNGLTFDSGSGSIFVADPILIKQFSISGDFMSSFPHVGGAGALAFNQESDSLWFVPNDEFAPVYEYSRTGVLLSTLVTGTRSQNIWGAEFRMICDPGNDCNFNGVSNADEIANGSPDCDLDGIPDDCQEDLDGDGTIDPCDSDIDGDGVQNECDPDQNSGLDCNVNGVLDSCDISSGNSLDCDLNKIPDECDFIDCNSNGVSDSCDLFSGSSPDCNANGIPDECDFAEAVDCNGNGILDDCDLIFGFSLDCNGNDYPDECDVNEGSSPDCDANGIPDQCQIATGQDCNQNGILDACEISNGIAEDCNLNGIPDLCDLLAGADCNSNGVLDACDISGGFSEDCDGNQVPDSCDIDGGAVDDDSNGIPDSCEPQAFRRGDLNTDGAMDVSDAVFGLEFLFGTQTVTCEDAADANDDGSLNIGDAVFILSALFNSGDLPPDPGSLNCGFDPTFDSLGCEGYGVCP